METAIQPFSFEGRYAVRAFEREGEPWFVAIDVCKALDIKDTTQAIERLDEDERGRCDVPTGGGIQSAICVNESGLYHLIFTSRKPEAEAFRKWVTSEVLPSIRKHGAYIPATMTQSEIIAAVANHMVDLERAVSGLKEGYDQHDQRLSDIEHRQTAIEEGSQYFTVIAFANRLGRRIDNHQAQSLGRYAGRYSRKHGYPIGQAPDARYGHVNTYHADVLRAVFGIAEQ